MELEKSIQNLSEIINLCEEEINNNNINITATLDLEDLKSLKTVLKALESYKKRYELAIEQNVKDYKNSIPKKKIEDKIEIYKNMCARLGLAIDKETFNMFDDKIKVLQELLEEK